MKDDPFADLLGRLEERDYSNHPPDEVLQRYLQRRLPDGERFAEEVGHLLAVERTERWTLAEVSLHVATCRECAARVAQIRAATNPVADSSQGERNSRLLRWTLTWALKRRLAYYIPLASVAVGLILLLVNLFLLNPPPPTHNCIFGGLAR